MQLKQQVRDLLLKSGYNVNKTTSNEELEAFFRKVRPVGFEGELIRVGGEGDGGYLVPDVLDGITACFSPGVFEIATFEEELAGRGIPSFMADYSVNGPPFQHPQFHFEKKFLGDVNDERYMRLEDWVMRHAPDPQADLILQMDIEGGEFPVIFDTPSAIWSRFRILVIEFHSMGMLFDQDAFKFANMAFDKLLRDFGVVHIHPNNGGPVWSSGAYEIPKFVEVTFLRRDWLKPVDKALEFPHPLDAPNEPGKQDLVLPRCWQ